MMQPNAPGHVEELIMEWCTSNGFGSDPVTVSTFTELANKLLATLGESVSDGPITDTGCPGAHQEHEESTELSLSDAVLQSSGSNYLLAPHARGELSRPNNKTGSRTPEQRRSEEFFLDSSGDWREVFHDGYWWVVGHQMMYPARDLDHARRLCVEFHTER